MFSLKSELSKDMKKRGLITIVATVGLSCSSSIEKSKELPNVNSDPSVSVNSVEPNQNAEIPPGSVAGKRERKIVDAPASGTPPPLNFREAAEDSEIAVTMNSDGSILEIRKFNTDPQLSRIEATWSGPKEKSLKIFLRRGKVLNVKTDRIQNLQTAPTSLLLEIAGLEATP